MPTKTLPSAHGGRSSNEPSLEECFTEQSSAVAIDSEPSLLINSPEVGFRWEQPKEKKRNGILRITNVLVTVTGIDVCLRFPLYAPLNPKPVRSQQHKFLFASKF
jgi:hypothetical protein